MRIVIVEDEKRAARGLRSLLERISADYTIVGEAPDGISAFELIKKEQPDLVFTDIRMQFMDGLALIKAVREYGLDTRFVIISAYEEFDYARAALKLNVTDYLVKPVTEEEVRQVMEHLKAQEKEQDQEKRLRDAYPLAHPVILKALDAIEKDYSSRISQKELAEKLGVTAEYFSYLFTKDVQETFSRFLRRYRISKACEQLDAGEESAETIAYRVGFSDMKYFYKCFKDETGQNLSEYRRKNL